LEYYVILVDILFHCFKYDMLLFDDKLTTCIL